MSSNGQLGRQPLGVPPLSGQPLGSQFNQNPQNMLSHTSSKTYPLGPLNGPPLTMHKQGAKKISSKENISSTQMKVSKD
jgi:hypothetical protein